MTRYAWLIRSITVSAAWMLTASAWSSDVEATRGCWVDHDAKQATVKCGQGSPESGETTWTFANPAQPEQVGKTADVYCSYAYPDERHHPERLKRRLMEEDLIKIANGDEPKCFKNAIQTPPVKAVVEEALAGLAQVNPPPSPPCPPPAVPPCPKGQYRVDGRCQSPKALQQIISRPVPSPEQKLARKLREQFDRTQECPNSEADYAVLKKITKEAKALGLERNVDVSLLIAKPEHPGPAKRDEKAARSCGYNSSLERTFDRGFYCSDHRTCFDQGTNERVLNCTRFEPGNSSVWRQVEDCVEILSYRNGGAGGDMVLIPLTDGVFIQVYQNATEEFYWGLIFAPTAMVKAQVLKEKAQSDQNKATVSKWQRWLKGQSKNTLNANDRKRLEKMIGEAGAALATD